jgi:hypothetical protein
LTADAVFHLGQDHPVSARMGPPESDLYGNPRMVPIPPN